MTLISRAEFENAYWKYYLMLGNKVINTFDYVELSKENFHTFSNAFTSLILLIGSELDGMLKLFCDLDKKRTIKDIRGVIEKKYPNIRTRKIKIKGHEIFFVPFEEWNINNLNPGWWEAFTSLKHNRTANSKEANLRNCLSILSALYLIEIEYFRMIYDMDNGPDILDDESSLFDPVYQSQYWEKAIESLYRED